MAVCLALPSQTPFPSGVVGTTHDDFGGPNGEASPYPSAGIVRGSAPSLAKLTGKPSRAFHG